MYPQIRIFRNSTDYTLSYSVRSLYFLISCPIFCKPIVMSVYNTQKNPFIKSIFRINVLYLLIMSSTMIIYIFLSFSFYYSRWNNGFDVLLRCWPGFNYFSKKNLETQTFSQVKIPNYLVFSRLHFRLRAVEGSLIRL